MERPSYLCHNTKAIALQYVYWKGFRSRGCRLHVDPPLLWHALVRTRWSKFSNFLILANCPRFGFVEQPRLVMGAKLFWNETNISNPALDRVLQVGTWSLTDDGKYKTFNCHCIVSQVNKQIPPFKRQATGLLRVDGLTLTGLVQGTHQGVGTLP